ncbi:MAG TPA: nitroreductase family protein [Methanotrichaceae archaeon]|nr:nitroreductase family protein [Methanotrichaceae archaeon]
MAETLDISAKLQNEVLKTIYQRRSVRNFCPDAVPDDAIKEIIRAGTFAPSAMNTQPWRFVVIRNREMIKKLSDKAKELWVEQSKNMQSLDLQRLADMVSRPNFNLFYNAPLLIMIFADTSGFTPQVDCSLAAENMMLAAWSLGLGSCYIGLAQPLERVTSMMKELGVSEKQRLVASLIFGFPVGGVLKAPERNRDVILKWID